MPKIQNYHYAKNNYYTLPKLSKRKNQVWIIEWYIEDEKGKFIRKRKRVKQIKPAEKRIELAKTLMEDISIKLHNVRNPNKKQSNNKNRVESIDFY